VQRLSITPPLSSRWHKYSVYPPKNAEGQSDTSSAYGVNFWLDAGNTWKNQFKISNRNGTAFEVRGGGGLEGQLHSKWSYTGVPNRRQPYCYSQVCKNCC
jgi:hypothetical protein